MEEILENSPAMLPNRLLLMDSSVLADQQKLILLCGNWISSRGQTQDDSCERRMARDCQSNPSYRIDRKGKKEKELYGSERERRKDRRKK